MKNLFTQKTVKAFKAFENPYEAERMKAYMRGQFDFYGIKSPERKEITKQIFAEGLPKTDEYIEVTKELWNQPQRELQYLAMEMVAKSKKHWDLSLEELVEFMVLNKSWWDTIDFIATNIVGEYLKKNPHRIEPLFKKWSYSDNLWLVRITIIYQLKYKDKVNTELLSDVIIRHSHSNEFFIQKAIGWALRQYSKFNSQWVLDFVNEHQLKPLSKREAVRLIK